MVIVSLTKNAIKPSDTQPTQNNASSNKTVSACLQVSQKHSYPLQWALTGITFHYFLASSDQYLMTGMQAICFGTHWQCYVGLPTSYSYIGPVTEIQQTQASFEILWSKVTSDNCFELRKASVNYCLIWFLLARCGGSLQTARIGEIKSLKTILSVILSHWHG